MAPKFSLQSVLDFRHSRVEALELDYSKLLEARQQGLEMQDQCQQELSQLFERLQNEQNGDLDLFTIAHLRSDTISVKAQLDQINQALAILEEKIEEKRKEMIAARQAEETLNTLKEKEVNRWQVEQARVESRQQDNVYIAQAFRRASGGGNVQ